MLTPAQARAHYDRLGRGQDRELRYAAPVFDRLLETSGFTPGDRVVELGCGTGALATNLAARRVAYVGIDISAVMLAETAARLEGDRHLLIQADVTRALPLGDGVAHHVIAAYLLDLMSGPAITRLLAECARLLKPGGRLILAGMAPGGGPKERLTGFGWRLVHRLAPARVGGCRPLDPAARLKRDVWRIERDEAFDAAGIHSRLVTATRLPE